MISMPTACVQAWTSFPDLNNLHLSPPINTPSHLLVMLNSAGIKRMLLKHPYYLADFRGFQVSGPLLCYVVPFPGSCKKVFLNLFFQSQRPVKVFRILISPSLECKYKKSCAVPSESPKTLSETVVSYRL